MRATSSKGTPIYPGYLAAISTKPKFGRKPFGVYNNQLMGMQTGCDCGPVTGCGCGGASSGSSMLSGYRGFGQTSSLDQVISNATSWLTGLAESSLPASAAVPSGVGSLGALATTLTQYFPYILIGIIIYEVAKKK